MARLLPLAALIVASCLAATAQAQPNLSEDQIRRLLDEYNTLKAQSESVQKQLTELRAELTKAIRASDILREELVRRGVDVEPLLAGPQTTQPDAPVAPVLIFTSPESMAEYLRDNFGQRVRPDLTQLQKEVAKKDFDSWLNSAAMLPTQVTWTFRIADVWRAATPEQVNLTYGADRQSLAPKLASLNRTLDELEMLELNATRMKAEQKARKERYEQRVKEFADAKPTHKQLAEKAMAQAYEQLKEINVQARQADGRYQTRKNALKTGPKAASRPDTFRIMMAARATRDTTIDVNIFCDEHDANRLMAAPKNTVVKVRGWISDIALAERLITLGYRIDHAEILAVNVEDSEKDTPAPPARPRTPQSQPATSDE